MYLEHYDTEICIDYCRPTYSYCRPCIVLSVLRHVKHFKAVYSVKTQTKAN